MHCEKKCVIHLQTSICSCFMDHNRILFILFLACLVSHPGRQALAQDPVFSQFFAAPLYLNPAFAGSSHCSRMSLNYRQLRSTENFHAINASFDTRAEALQGGIGMIATSDLSGMVNPDAESGLPVMRNSVGAIYAYHLQAAASLNVHFGMQASYIRNDSAWHLYQFAVDEPEPDNAWVHAVDLSAGMLFYTDRIYGGLAVHHMNQPHMSLFTDVDSRLKAKLTVHAGTYFYPGGGAVARHHEPSFFVSPNLVFMHQAYSTHLNYGLYAGFESIVAGFWFRHWINAPIENNHLVVGLVGIRIDNYRIGFSYDRSFSGFTDVSHGVFELSFAFEFGCPRRNIRQHIIKQPTF